MLKKDVVTNFVLPPLLSYVDCYSAIIFSLYEVICLLFFCCFFFYFAVIELKVLTTIFNFALSFILGMIQIHYLY